MTAACFHLFSRRNLVLGSLRNIASLRHGERVFAEYLQGVSQVLCAAGVSVPGPKPALQPRQQQLCWKLNQQPRRRQLWRHHPILWRCWSSAILGSGVTSAVLDAASAAALLAPTTPTKAGVIPCATFIICKLLYVTRLPSPSRTRCVLQHRAYC